MKSYNSIGIYPAGTEFRILKAGLLPSTCIPHLDQFLKYFDKLQNAENI